MSFFDAGESTADIGHEWESVASAMVTTLSQARSIQQNNKLYALQAAGVDVIALSLGEAFFDVPMPDMRGLSSSAHHYTHSRGNRLLRQRLCDYYAESFGVLLDADRNAMVTAGSKVAVYMALLALVDPGDEVLVPEPLWVSYPDQVRMCGAKPVMLPPNLSVGEYIEHIGPRTKALIVNSPRNPDGLRLSAEDLARLHELARRCKITLIADEAYAEFLPIGERFTSVAQGDPSLQHTVVCNSLSKSLGISGWRLGYMFANAALLDQILKLQQHISTCAPSLLSAWAAVSFDEQLAMARPQIASLMELRTRAASRLCAETSLMPGDSTFYLFVSISASRLSSVDFADRLLDEHQVSVVPGIGYGDSCDDYVRVSLGAECASRIDRGLDALQSLIRSTS